MKAEIVENKSENVDQLVFTLEGEGCWRVC